MPGIDTLNITAAKDADIIANTINAIICNNLLQIIHRHNQQHQHCCYTQHTTTTVLRPFVWDYPGEPVPEETLTHPPS